MNKAPIGVAWNLSETLNLLYHVCLLFILKYQLRWEFLIFKQQKVRSIVQSNGETSRLFLCKIMLNLICGNSTNIFSLVGEKYVWIEIFLWTYEERIRFG